MNRLKTEVRISPGLKGQVIDGVKAAHFVISHELIHSYHYMKGFYHTVSNFNADRENPAYCYNLVYAKHYNMPTLAAQARSVITNYNYDPALSWRKLIESKPWINLGVK